MRLSAWQKARPDPFVCLTLLFAPFVCSGAEAQKQATSMAADKMKTLAALHNPDMIAGGKDAVTSMGDRGVNSSLGSQWAKEGRVSEMDKAAREVPEAERGNTKMNTKLKPCP